MAVERGLLMDILSTIKTRGLRVIENKSRGIYDIYNDEFKDQKYCCTLESYRVSYLVDLNDLARLLDIEEDLMKEVVQRDGTKVVAELRHSLIILNQKDAKILYENGNQSMLLPGRSHAENKQYNSLRSLLDKR